MCATPDDRYAGCGYELAQAEREVFVTYLPVD
jgi:hypothetical protein